ncbi:MAG: AMP-binding protein [Sulfurovum sp.]|nr:AMP-binding protein [Sulfurovum sp.]
MYLSVLNDNQTVKKYYIEKDHFNEERLYGHVGYIGTQSKESNALNLLKAYFSQSKAILLDETNKAIVKQLQSLNVQAFSKKFKTKTIFDREDFFLMYYTSGSTGIPVGALKSRKNIEEEVHVLTELLQTYGIKKVIVTVPFIHLYGTLFGLFYPLLNDIDILFKEHFLPHDLLDTIEPHTMVVTTPLYIKALNKIEEGKDLSQSLFISSTAPLDDGSIEVFNLKYSADIMQIYGSTETGGIAYKVNKSELWKPFSDVRLSVNSQNELSVSSPFVSSTLYENSFTKTNAQIQTFDYIELENEGFRLIGRSSKIFKLAGKRYSTVQIENVLEDVKGINKALVFVEIDKSSLRGEYIDIIIETKQHFSNKQIKKILQDNLSNLKFSIKLKSVDEIPVNKVGKKLQIR